MNQGFEPDPLNETPYPIPQNENGINRERKHRPLRYRLFGVFYEEWLCLVTIRKTMTTQSVPSIFQLSPILPRFGSGQTEITVPEQLEERIKCKDIEFLRIYEFKHIRVAKLYQKSQHLATNQDGFTNKQGLSSYGDPHMYYECPKTV
ncbi:hypothetical protein CLF_112911 [Clonorchis sinensis]|uniref:Uncharacterized protein n=1 Tax=Clonorchis sinensis TaxID=79923 RepID=G7YX93_CLOSI|nr:hypothetical protein CLF_112911 [Clonorchis sinensis]